MLFFFTADQHFGHAKILEYESRPFISVEEMDEELIRRHNSVVRSKDTVIHAGDFAFCKTRGLAEEKYINRLNGKHVFLYGSHDNWMGPRRAPDIHTVQVDKQLIVICHYAMRVWPRSHYGSWHVYGHTHCRLEPFGLSLDVGVDCHNYYPVSFRQLQELFQYDSSCR